MFACNDAVNLFLCFCVLHYFTYTENKRKKIFSHHTIFDSAWPLFGFREVSVYEIPHNPLGEKYEAPPLQICPLWPYVFLLRTIRFICTIIRLTYKARMIKVPLFCAIKHCDPEQSVLSPQATIS